MVKVAKRCVNREDRLCVRAGIRVRLAGPFDLNAAAREEGTQHVEVLLEANRQRMASFGASGTEDEPKLLGVVGAGVMGTAIACDALEHGLEVLLMDVDEGALERAAETIQAESDRRNPRRFGTTGDLSEIAGCEIVLEAVLEDEMKKGPLLRDLDERMSAEKLLATNTSTIPISRLARMLQRHPERLCGTHFFLPLPERPVVEVIFSGDTLARAKADSVRLAMTLGRSALFAPDAVGFVVNRLMMPYVSEGMQLLTEGVEPDSIEQVAMAFGMPKGPLSLLDEVGLDTALDCGWIFAGAYEDRIAVSPLLVAMVKARRLGQKNGAGFFRYESRSDGSSIQESDPAAMEIVARWKGEETGPTAEDIAARLFLPMVFEGARMIETHEDTLPGDVDLGAVLGLGMSAGRGGPLHWCDRVGVRQVIEIAQSLESLGSRMEPPEALRRMAAAGTTFHG